MVHTNLNAILKFPKNLGGYRIPVRVGSFVTEGKTSTTFHKFCKYCKTQTNQDTVCRNEDCKHNVLLKEDIESTFVYGQGDTKVVDSELLAEISKFERNIKVKGSIPKSHTIVTLGGSYILPREFKKEEDFDPNVDQEPFEAYRNLHSALTNGKDIVVQFQRKRVNIAVLRAIGSVIVMLKIPFQEAVRVLDEEVDVKVSREEKQGAKAWIDSIGEVDVGSIVDTYRQQVEDIITGKIKPKKSTKSKPKQAGKVSFFLIPKESLKDKPKKPVVKGGKKK